jgi:xylan 1,4-beta-xylosidase
MTSHTGIPDQGMRFLLSRGLSDAEEIRTDVLVYFVVTGTLHVTVHERQFSLGREDILLINAGVQSSAVSKDASSILCKAVFPASVLAENEGEAFPYFSCCTVDRKGANAEHRYRELRDIFMRLIHNEVKIRTEKNRSDCLVKSYLYRMLDCLFNNFMIGRGDFRQELSTDERISGVLQYISLHYQEPVSLTHLAEEHFMSKSAFSRLFRKSTGINFADYLVRIRLSHAEQALMYTDRSITRIAVDSGFTNSSVFTRTFRAQKGISPTEYRKANRKAPEETGQTGDDDELRSAIRSLMPDLANETEVFDSGSADKAEGMAVKGEGIPFRKTWNIMMNLGSAESMTTANMQFHAQYLKEKLQFTYGRIWSVFSRRMRISDGKSIGMYNYDRLDAVLDFFTENGIRPFLDLGIRPDTAITEPGKAIFYEEDYIHFASAQIWEDLIRDLILHIRTRYGQKTADTWKFEFSFIHMKERSIPYYEDPDFSYPEAFRKAFHIIRELLPGAGIGGPMDQLELDDGFLADFLRYASDNECMPDFVSFMLFPYSSEFKDGAGIETRAVDREFEIRQIKEMKKALSENGASGAKLCITEWNSTLSNRNYLNDSCFRAAYFAEKMAEISQEADLCGVWAASDWISSYYDTGGVAAGAIGLLTKDSILKPAYYALQFLNLLGEKLLFKDQHAIVTETASHSFYVLLFHAVRFSSGYYMRSEAIRSPGDLDSLFENAGPLAYSLELKGLENSRYVIKKRTVSPKHGSLLDSWKKFRFDPRLPAPEIHYLRDICIPDMEMDYASAKDGTLKLSVQLLPHEITLLHIYPQ